MKIINYRSEQPEVKELLEATFGSVEVEAFVTEESIRFGDEIVLKYTIKDKPLIVEGHEFELLRDITVDIPELGISSKTMTEAPNARKLSHIILNYWISAKLGKRTSGASKSSESRTKIRAEKELLKQYLASRK